MSKKFAVFDIDGTLIRWQLYHAVINRLAKRGDLGDDMWQILHDARMKWKNRERDSSFAAYERVLVGEFLARIKTLDHAKYIETVDEITEEYIGQAYTYTRNLIAKLKRENYFLLIVSGSPREIVAKVAKHYGFDDYEAAEFVCDDQLCFTGQINSPVFDKNKALTGLIAKHDLSWEGSYAIGDSISDATMLELVENPIAFNPERELFETAKQNSWPIVVERKNVIYELSPDEGRYTLR